ncbi:MAG: outer-membrane lipoprotein carrier protein LolA [Paramuribaculum sp.]|nr:outer-membrane lipoprotein carrier protein LolA [Paramuribaculum sp.]
MMIRKILTLICLILVASVCAGAAENEAKILRDAADKLNSAKSIVATCRISSKGAASNAALTMSGNKFTVKSPDMEIWFDGKNQWTYSPRTGEVNITEPSAEELSQINPISVINHFANGYNASLLPASKGVKNIRLTAKSVKSDISVIDIKLNASTLTPDMIKLQLKSGESVTITVSSLKFGNALPASTFTYSRKFHPDAEIIDLR